MYRKRKRRKIMDLDVREVMREMGKRGGRARAKALTPERRQAIAIKASEAAKQARKAKTVAKAKGVNNKFVCEMLTRKDGRGK